MVEASALELAERECLADSEAARRAELDRQYIERFAVRVRELFSGCPPGREMVIAEHAYLRYSGRIGRSAAAKSLDEDAVRLAVISHIRHTETPYDELLARGYERWDAREQVRETVDRILGEWEATE